MPTGSDSQGSLPEGIEGGHHRDLMGSRAYHPWARRAGLGLLLAIVVVALLNVFGQASTTSTAAGPAATLTLRGPTHLRGGLIFQERFTIQSRREIKTPKLVLSPGWFDGITLNEFEPSAGQEGSRNGSVAFTLESMTPGERQVIWTEWQVNPTNVTHRALHVDLYDGGTPLAQIGRTITVLP
ncbi:MAG: hypothetical protein QOD53_2103 [Thermoleophilaceae bacterium]|nr:hypothetical protein [Thermoleophilaceae bacterium]